MEIQQWVKKLALQMKPLAIVSSEPEKSSEEKAKAL